MRKIDSALTLRNPRSARWKYFKDNYLNLVYMIPVIVGIVGFTILPMGISFIYSICPYEMIDPTATLGAPTFEFYLRAFTTDLSTVLHSYYVTFRYALIVTGISFVGSYILALILNQKVRGIKTYRILYYLPCLIPGLAASLLWNGLTKQTGYFNLILKSMGLQPFTFYSSNDTVFVTMIILSLWGFSGNMIMWLAQFKNIPNELYEEASLSGAGYFSKLFHITIPMSTSMIFYLLIMNLITSLQSLGNYAVYVDNGKPADLNFVGTHIYETAYVMSHDINYACALSWILFVVIGLLTLLIFKTSRKWVYYAEEN